MWIILIAIIAFIVLIAWLTIQKTQVPKGENLPKSRNIIIPKNTDDNEVISQSLTVTVPSVNVIDTDKTNDFDRWISILSKDKSNAKHFELYATKAAILWNDGDKEIYIICINNFNNGFPGQSHKYDYFIFNVSDWYWSGNQPRGAAEMIKEEIQNLFGCNSANPESMYVTHKNRVLEKENPLHYEEFLLHETKSLIWYVSEKKRLRILCPHRFSKGVPSKSYKYFDYDIASEQWVSSNGYPTDHSPQGCKDAIMKKILEFSLCLK